MNQDKKTKSSRELTKNIQKWSKGALHQKQNDVLSIQKKLRERHNCAVKIDAN